MVLSILQKCSCSSSLVPVKNIFVNEPDCGSSYIPVNNHVEVVPSCVSRQGVSLPILTDNVVPTCTSRQTVSLPIATDNIVSGNMDEIFSSGPSTFTPIYSSGEGCIPNGVFSSGDSGIGVSSESELAPLPVVQSPSVTLPAVESPMITISAPTVPAPRVLASRCVCTKTIVRPQVFQRIVTVPRVQRYLKRTVTPVVENVVYKSRPIATSFGCSGFSQGASTRSGSSSGTVVLAESPNPVLISDSNC